MMETLRTSFDTVNDAIFAKTLDLAGFWWTYSPNEDFNFIICPTGLTLPLQSCIFIAYKPIASMFDVELLTDKLRSHPVESILVWGEATDKPRWQHCSYITYPIFSSFWKYGWGDEEGRRFDPLIDNGRNAPYSTIHRTEDVLGINQSLVNRAFADTVSQWN